MEVVRALIEMGADVKQDTDHGTPLAVSTFESTFEDNTDDEMIQRAHVAIAQMLRAVGAV